MIDYDLSHVPSEWLDVTLTPGPGAAIHQPVLALTITNGSRVLVCDCIHNLSPEDQIAVRGKTVEWWMKWVGTMPQQITPDQWETTPLDLGDDG